MRFEVHDVSVGDAGLTARPAVVDTATGHVVKVYRRNERAAAEKHATRCETCASPAVAADPAPADAITRPLVVVPCGGAKLGRPAIAERLYTGSFHRLAMRAAHVLTTRDRIRILSGRYGLLELDDVIEPYDQRINSPFALAGVNVVEQGERMGLLGECPILLLPAAYDVVACRAWPRNTNPLRGASGIGSMQHRLKAIVDGDMSDL